MKINNIGAVSLYTSSPGDPVRGYIAVQNDYSSQTVDVFWSYGVYDGVENFSIYAYVIQENYTFQGTSSILYETGSFATPNNPGTWDLFAILADDIYFDGDMLAVVGNRGAKIEENAWTISALAELEVLNVGVDGA